MGDVVGEASTSRRLVSPLQRFDQLPVMVHGRLAACSRVDMGGSPDIGAGLQPQALDDGHEHRRPCRAVDVEMEGVVEFRGGMRLVRIIARESAPRRPAVSRRKSSISSAAEIGQGQRRQLLPRSAGRARARSSSRSRVTSGTRTERFGIASSACSETRRASASRTGIVLVCNVSASSTMRNTCPASNTP